MKKTVVRTNRLMILAVMMVMTISARSAMPLGSSKNAMLTCTSLQYITMLQLCTIMHLLRITQRLL